MRTIHHPDVVATDRFLNVPYRRLLSLGLAGLLLAGVRAAVAEGEFALEEYIGHGWANECVSFPLTAAQKAQADKGLALLGPGGQELAWQIDAGAKGKPDRISMQVDLPAYGTWRASFGDQRRSATTALKVEETANEVVITNGKIGLKLRKQLQNGEGPIAAVRLLSGTWTGGSTFTPGNNAKITAWTVKVSASGPVFAEIDCKAEFSDKGKWGLRFRIENNEPVIVVKEAMDAPAGGAFAVLLGDKSFQPSHMYCRDSRAEAASVACNPIGGFYLEPWLHWNNAGRGNWVAVLTPPPVAPPERPDVEKVDVSIGGGSDKALDSLMATTEFDPKPKKKKVVAPPAAPTKEDDMLMIGLMNPSVWVDPAWKGKAGQAAGSANASIRDGVLAVDLQVAGGRRSWLLGVLDRKASAALIGQRVAPPPQQFIVKHGDFPLNKVKDFVLRWDGDDDTHPCLYVRKKDLPDLKSRLVSDPKEVERWVSQQPIDKYFLDSPIKEFLASGDRRLGKRIAEKAEEFLQTTIDWYIKQDYLQCPGTAPHMQSFLVKAINLIDPVLSTDVFSDEARKRVLAKIAFIGYVIAADDYWSPERGYSGFANMTSVVALYRTLVACMVPGHPEAKGWAEKGLNQLRWQTTAWSDEDGGWVEAPHYAMVSFDHMLAGFSMAANAGLSDDLYTPRMRKVTEWFAGISTPRDSRIGGFRHQPPIGNTYHGEPTGLYGLMAAMWKQKDPDFASQLQWLHEEHGRFGNLGIGWDFPSMAGYRWLMNSSGVKAKPATFGSARFRNTGVVLRNTMQTDRETYLHMIAGGNHAHYDDDSGSIILYGKGRALCDDWGYIGLNPRHWHSLVSGGGAGGMSSTEFFTGPRLDYVKGVGGAWTREVLFLKDADPLGPNYFVLKDTMAANEASSWKLWLLSDPWPERTQKAEIPKAPDLDTGPKLGGGADDMLKDVMATDDKGKALPKPGVVLNAGGAYLNGGEDVDMDILFHNAAKLGLKTEEGSQRASCGYRDGKDMSVENRQTALIASLPGSGAYRAVLYPRLKTEKPPKVTWLADGQVIEVETAAGKDCIFTAPKPVRAQPQDGGLVPVGERMTQFGCMGLQLAGSGQPFVIVNRGDADVKNDGGFVLKPGEVTVHPGEKDPVTIVWQSPAAGVVTVDAVLSDGEAGKNEAEPWRADGVQVEIRKDDKAVAKGSVAEGARDVAVSAKSVVVARGDLVRVVILPGKCHWWDVTIVSVRIRDDAGKEWDFAKSLAAGEPLAHEKLRDGKPSLWWVCAGDGAKFSAPLIGKALLPLWNVTASPEALHATPEGRGTPYLDMARGAAGSGNRKPEDGLTMHPGPRNPVSLAWRSPVDGTVSVQARVTDADAGKHDTEIWRSDGVLYMLRKGKETLEEGAIDNGGEKRISVDGVAVTRGEIVRLVVYPGYCEWWDSTTVDLVITDASGKKWDAREALLRGEKLGNEMGSDPAKAVWWACEGDGPTLDPALLTAPPLPELAGFGGKIQFQGTLGSVQVRKDSVTLSLGASGRLQYGKHELISDGPASRTDPL